MDYYFFLNASKDGLFSVSSFFLAISIGPLERNFVCSIWKLKSTERMVIFGRLALRKRILTMDNLRRRGGGLWCKRMPHVLKRGGSCGPPYAALQNCSGYLEVGGWMV